MTYLFSQARFVALVTILMGSLAGCQGPQFNMDRMTASEAGDSTLAVSGCEGDMGRGYEICRFMDGALLATERITLVVPFGPNSLATNIRMRYGAKIYMLQTNSPNVSIKYSDLFDGGTFTKNDDGPIQIITKTLNKDGSFYESLGYLFVIVLTKGYSIEPSRSITKCSVEYSEMGESKVECNK
jgi:hypothetical protein